MKISKTKIIAGKLITSEIKMIKQSELTSDCWLIQFWGLDACNDCEALNKRSCGGKKIRAKLLNALDK